MDLKDKKILIIGYAVTGKSVVDYLIKQGAQLTINDRGDLSKDPSVALLKAQGIKVVDKGHPLSLLEEDFTYIIKTPGIPYSVPLIEQAVAKGIPVITDVEIASQITKARIIGVTGSNGKTTTSSMIYELLRHRQAHQTFIAGNIGIPTLEVANQAQKDDDIVMELSSFQLKGTQQFCPDIAVICNIFEAHLDYHQTREDYVAAKLNLVKHMNAENYLVYNYDLVELREWLTSHPAQPIPFAIKNVDDLVETHGAYYKNGDLYFQGEPIMAAEEMYLPGEHNIANALAAIAVARLRGVEAHAIKDILTRFQGMPHRLQPIVETHQRIFYNDSKSTNMVATITALKSFKQPVIYIGGGLDRGNEFDDLIPYLKWVRAAFLYGESKDKMARVFSEAGITMVQTYDDLEEATQAAYQVAQAGEVVLFSPSNASWDQYQNFEQRGDHFVQIIQQLIEHQPYADKE